MRCFPRIIFYLLGFVFFLWPVMNEAEPFLLDTPHQGNLFSIEDKIIESAKQQLKLILQKNQWATYSYENLKKTVESDTMVSPGKPIKKETLAQAELELALANANLDAENIAKEETIQSSDATNRRIRELENQLQNLTLSAGTTHGVEQRVSALQMALSHQKILLKWQERQVDALEEGIRIAQQNRDLRSQLRNLLLEHYNFQKQTKRELDLAQKEIDLQAEQRQWLDTLEKLNQQLQAAPHGAKALPRLLEEDMELKILKAQESSNLIHLQLSMLHVKTAIITIEDSLGTHQSVNTLNNEISQLKELKEELKNLNTLIEKKIIWGTKRKKLELKKVVEESKESKENAISMDALLSEWVSQYEGYQKELGELMVRNEKVSAAIQNQLKQSLARRQGLPGLNVQAWGYLGYKLVNMPIYILHMLNALKEQCRAALHHLQLTQVFWILGTQSIVWISFFWLRHSLNLLVNRWGRDRRRISDNIRFVIFRLLRCNVLTIYLIISFSFLLAFLGVSIKSFSPIVGLALVFLIFKMLMGLARIVLIETAPQGEGKDVKLYGQLRWTLWVGGILTMLTVLALQLPVGFEVRDFLSRLFSLFLLLVAILLWRGASLIPHLLEPYMDATKLYVLRAVKLLSFLIPFILLVTALIGFFGYVDLAWTISQYEIKLLFVLALYVLARGFLDDLFEWVSKWCIRHLHHGWLWTQEVLKPLDKLSRVGLLLAGVAALFALYGWGWQSSVMKEMRKALRIHLLELKGTIITPLTLVELTITGFVLYWLSRWARELAYRWMFSKTEDVGLRNSLAAFTQYATVILGLLVALKMTGIDLGGVEYILGGFAIAVGFGMRDLLKNYASGILLLLERPLRTGDLVSIGNFEGEVTRIGMRSISLKTWDHMEVLVPNSETFDKPFTNWTHQDGIVRTVISLKVDRKDNPEFIKTIIFDVLLKHPEVVSIPEPEVYMTQMSENTLDFEVRYFINLQMGSSRVKVRSEILFLLWETFKHHNIVLPSPQQDVHVHTLFQQGGVS